MILAFERWFASPELSRRLVELGLPSGIYEWWKSNGHTGNYRLMRAAAIGPASGITPNPIEHFAAYSFAELFAFTMDLADRGFDVASTGDGICETKAEMADTIARTIITYLEANPVVRQTQPTAFAPAGEVAAA